jgi:hypothetical protein
LELDKTPVETTYLKRELQKVSHMENPINISLEEKKTNTANRFVKLQRKEQIGVTDENTGIVKPENRRLQPKNEK